MTGIIKRYLKAIANGFLDLFHKNHLTNACSLAYATLLSIIPLVSVLIYTSSLSKHFMQISLLAKNYASKTLLPASSNKIIGYLDVLSHNATQVPTISFIFLLVTAWLLMMSIDSTMKAVWEKQAKQFSPIRYCLYFIAIFAIPPVIAVGSLLSSLFLQILDSSMQMYIPWLINTLMLAFFYFITANRTIQIKNILICSLLTAGLLEVIKFAFTLYVTNYSSYQTIYGTLAVIPVFLLWVYLLWTVIIYGALVIKQLKSR